MRRVAAVALAVVLLLLSPAAAAQPDGPDGLREGLVESAVVPLNGESFAPAVKANPYVLVNFYAPWCGHCRQLEPEFEKAAGALAGRVVFAKVDATVEVELSEIYRIDGYPTLHFFKRGHGDEYGGGRQNESLVAWVEEAIGPALTVPASENSLQVALKKRRASTYFVARGSAQLRELIGGLAESHRSLGAFYFSEATEGTANVLQAHRGFGEIAELTGEDVADGAKVEQFLKDEALPAFGEVDDENYAGYLQRATEGMLWVCFHPDSFIDDTTRYLSVFKKVATEFRQFPTACLDTRVYQEHVKEELGVTDFPAVVLQVGNLASEDSETPKRYRLQLAPEGITTEAVSTWISEVLAGKVEEDEELEELDADGEGSEEGQEPPEEEDDDPYDEDSADEGASVEGAAASGVSGDTSAEGPSSAPNALVAEGAAEGYAQGAATPTAARVAASGGGRDEL